jgi:hypothetical protein
VKLTDEIKSIVNTHIKGVLLSVTFRGYALIIRIQETSFSAELMADGEKNII